jgi:glutamate-1-semialdehyde 2,1-aminomutase
MSVNPKLVPTASEALYDRAKQVMPGGCSRNTVLRKPHPLYVANGEGCYVTDIEGVTRIDFANNMASLIHGHSHPAVVTAVGEQLQRGTAFTLATEQEIVYAEAMCERVATFENIRFVNSGTEAVMSALKASRAYTGRPKIAKVEGAYHGIYDFAEVSQSSTPANWGRLDRPASVPVSYGTPKSTLDDVVVIPFNDAGRAIEILDAHSDELACVLLDLVPHRIGLMPATKEFVSAIRDWTRKNDALLVCDEVITFRCRYQGAQTFYDIEPDLTRTAGPVPACRHVFGKPNHDDGGPHGDAAVRRRGHRETQRARPTGPRSVDGSDSHRRYSGLCDRREFDVPHPDETSASDGLSIGVSLRTRDGEFAALPGLHDR